MSIKASENKRLRKWINRIEQEKEEAVESFKQASIIQTAYLVVLLKKLGATEESPVTITGEEIKEAMNADSVKVDVSTTGEWKFFIAEE